MVKFAQMPKYEAYKDSGVEWLGEIPESWSVLANKHIFKLKKNLVGRRSKEYELLSLTLKGIIKRNMENPEGKFPAEFDTYQEVNEGDFVFCLFDVEETPRTVGLSPYYGMITGAYTVFETAPELDKSFLYYFYLNLDTKKRLKPLYTGLRNTISKDAFLSFKTFVPTREEQTLIGDFLDQKTAQIDAAIAIKEQQIELLKERKQIIIQQAVTQGLDPNVPMKDSGVEWIGQIPEHWEVQKLKFCTYINLNTLPENTSSKLSMRYVDIGSVTFEDGITKTETFCFGQAPSRARRLAKYGDTVVSTVRTYLKAISFIKNEYSDCVFSTGFSILTPRLVLYPAFLADFVKSNTFIEQVDLVAKGMSYPAINSTELSNLYVVLPPKPEQIIISKFISTQVAYIEKSVLMLNLQINKFKEYKITLINSAVTGKIKITPEMLQA